jgi:hypothetical protein
MKLKNLIKSTIDAIFKNKAITKIWAIAFLNTV